MANRAGWVYRVALNHGRNRLRRRRLERSKPPPGAREADYYEGRGTSAYELRADAHLHTVIGTGCGA